MVRRCWDTRGGTWRESCTRWEAGRSYTMEVDTSHYPYPFRAMRGTWSVADAADGGSRITMRFDYRMPWGSLGALLGADAGSAEVPADR